MFLVGCSHQDFDAKIFATSRHYIFTYLLGLKENENTKGNDVKKPAKPGLQPGPWSKCLSTEPTLHLLVQNSKIIRLYVETYLET